MEGIEDLLEAVIHYPRCWNHHRTLVGHVELSFVLTTCEPLQQALAPVHIVGKMLGGVKRN